jgi:hypothetical protein
LARLNAPDRSLSQWRGGIIEPTPELVWTWGAFPSLTVLREICWRAVAYKKAPAWERRP